MNTSLRVGVALLAGASVTLAPRVAHAQVRFERTGYRLTSIGERIAVSARVVDGARRPVANANIRWRIADPTIATVTPQGVVVSRRAGYTKLWAVSGRDSASALILVDQWAARFDFSPAVVRLDAVGAKMPLRIQVRDAAGHLIAEAGRRTSACRSLNNGIAALAANGEVLAHGNGTTYVRCTDRGIADSVRVEVRQRVDRATIADKGSFGARVVGDTFKLQLRAQDRAGDLIRDVQASWASLNPSIVAVDALTGMARSVGPGEVKVIAQAGDVTDTVSIRVQPTLGMVLTGGGDSLNALPPVEGPKMPTLRIDAIYPFEGDTTLVKFIARDALGAEVPSPDVTLRSSDTSIVRMVGSQRVLPRKAGSAYLIGRFGSVLDSALVTVRARSSKTLATTDESAESSPFKRPTFDTVAARASYRRAMQAARDSIFNFSPVGRKATGRLISFSVVAGQAAHSTRLDANVVEKRTGLLYGGVAEVAPLGWLKLSAELRTGTLSTNQTTGQDLTVTEAEADLTFQPADWFGLRAGYMRRAVSEGSGSTPVATQQWNFPRVSALTRFNFVGDAVTTLIGISILPGASYTGYYDTQTPPKPVKPDPFSLAGEAGLEVHSGILSAGLIYYVERFSFPKVNNNTRVDQFSTLRLRLGLQVGR